MWNTYINIYIQNIYKNIYKNISVEDGRSVRIMYHRGATINDVFDSCMVRCPSENSLRVFPENRKRGHASRAGTFGTYKMDRLDTLLAAAAAADTTTQQHN